MHESAIYCPFYSFAACLIGAESDVGNWNSVLSDKGTSPLQKRYYEKYFNPENTDISYIYTHTHTVLLRI
jgi:hypothetical protein